MKKNSHQTGTLDKDPLSIGRPGPFQVIEDCGAGKVDEPMESPRRRYECSHYDCCLDLAAALNWDNFTCRGCNETVNESLLWRAHQARRTDSVASSICDQLPDIDVQSSNNKTGETTSETRNSNSPADVYLFRVDKSRNA